MLAEQFGHLERGAVGAVDIAGVFDTPTGAVLGAAGEQGARRSCAHTELRAGRIVEDDGFQHRARRPVVLGRRVPKLRAMQDGRALSTKRTLWPAAPGRVFRAPWSLVANADQAGGDVTVSFA